MAPPPRVDSPQREGRMALAVHSIKNEQLKSERATAVVYDARQTTLQRRQKGIGSKRGSRAHNRLLLECEE